MLSIRCKMENMVKEIKEKIKNKCSQNHNKFYRNRIRQ